MGDVAGTPRVIRFGVFEVDLRSGELRKSGLRIRLQEQPFQILAMLLEHPGEVVTREELEKKLWGVDTFVDFEHGLATAIKKLREALGDSADNPRFIETLPRRGYRFIAPVDAGVGLVPALGRPQGVPLQPATLLRWRWLAIGVPSLVIITAAALIYWLTRPLQPPWVVRIVQLTHSSQVSPGPASAQEAYPSMVTDGARLYFMEGRGDTFALSSVSTAGGETRPIPIPWQKELPWPADMSPDGTRLLIREHLGPGVERPIWVLPTEGGPAHRVGDILGHDATWSPDGQEIVYAAGNELFRAKADGSESRKLVTVSGRAFWLRWSPDGRCLRFTVRAAQIGSNSLWQLNADGTNLHPLLPGWNNPPMECCGNWTPNGKYFVFQSRREGRLDIWALRERGSPFREPSRQPVRLTAGPMHFVGPVPSKDGKKLFVMGLPPPRIELVKYDSPSHRLVPYRGPLAKNQAVSFVYSADGRWVAYRTNLDGSLWRSKADGTERLQLVSPPLGVQYTSWSPDGKAIVFTGWMPGGPTKIYLVSVDGGNPQPLLPDDQRAQTDADFSPDGNRIVFGRMPDYIAESGIPKAIHILDLKTKKVSKLPGSEGLFSPHWTPDGGYIVAMPLDHSRQMRFDFKTQKWTELVNLRLADGELSRTGTYLYLRLFPRGSLPIYRLRIRDGQLEQVIGATDIPRLSVAGVRVAGMDLDDSPVFFLLESLGDIYALEWEAP